MTTQTKANLRLTNEELVALRDYLFEDKHYPYENDLVNDVTKKLVSLIYHRDLK